VEIRAQMNQNQLKEIIWRETNVLRYGSKLNQSKKEWYISSLDMVGNWKNFQEVVNVISSIILITWTLTLSFPVKVIPLKETSH